MKDEIWKPVPSLDNNVEVSSHGRVRRLPHKITYSNGRVDDVPCRILKGNEANHGYHMTCYKSKKFLTHRLIAEAFLGIPDDKLSYQTVNHKNGLKLDNRPENLEWASYKKNNNHARYNRLNRQHGENNNFSKHSDQLVAALKKVHLAYGTAPKILAEIFGIPAGTVYDILSGATRKRG